ncbi:MAG: Hsp20/alpha crystallin family protein [Chitinophagaceae bacterium]
MTLIHYKNRPATSFDQLWNNWFNDVLPFNELQTSSVPAANIEELQNEFVLTLNAPGRKKEDFKIVINKNALKIEAETAHQDENERNNNLKRREFSIASFKRSFYIDETIDTTNIEAKYEQGLLSIRLPKKKQTSPAMHQISVQ